MWNFRKLEIDGLMSFGQATIEFVDGEVVVIYGVNKDAGVEKSNGSGKSALLEGFGFGVTGSPLRKVKIGELVNDDAICANVSVTLDNTGLNEVMQINRIAYKSKSSVCQILINGELIANLTSTDEANKFIETKLGITRDDLLNFFVLTAAKFTPFLDASDTKKKEVINRFSNGIIVDKSITDLEEDKAECNEELKVINIEYGQHSSTLGALESTLVDVEKGSNEVDDTGERISKLGEEIHEINKENLVKSKEIGELKLDFADAEVEIKAISIKEIDDLYDEIHKNNDSIEVYQKHRLKLRVDLQEIDHKIRHIKLKMDGSISCPSCSHEFDPTDKGFDLKKAQKELWSLDVTRGDIVDDGRREKGRIDSLQSTTDLLTEKVGKITKVRSTLLDELGEIEDDISDIWKAIKLNNSRAEANEIKIEALSSKEEKDVVTPLKNKISSVKAKLEPVAVKLGELTEELDDYNVQLDVFRRFKSHLANMSLKSMEGLVNDYLDNFGSDIFLQLNSDSKLASGKTKEKIGATLVRNGVDIGSFNKRSGGEKAAINLAFAKTLSHLINLNAGENRGLNLLIIDEILDSTDAEGLANIVRSFEREKDTVMLISHIPLPSSVGKQLTVCKENDLSHIISEDEKV